MKDLKNMVLLGDILQEFNERLGQNKEPEILTLTEKKGFVAQRERFNKRLAVENTSNYKFIRRNDIAFNPYLLWARAIAQNKSWDKAIISPLYPTFRVKKGFDPHYVDYLLRSVQMESRYDRISFGSVPRKRRASVADFLNIKVTSPPSFLEQTRIAEILDKADALRQKCRLAIQKLDTLLQSVFLDIFGDPITNAKSLPLKPLNQFGEIITGNTPSRVNLDFYGTEIEWIKSDNINTPHRFLSVASEHLSIGGKEVGRIAPAGSVLVTCIAGSPDCIGNAAIANREIAFNQQINAIVPNSQSDFRFIYTQCLIGKKAIQRASTNSMKGMVSKGSFQKVRFLSPSFKEQQKFGELFDKYAKIFDNYLQMQILAEEMFRSIQLKYFGII